MSTEIIKILDAICEKFGIAIDWTSQNAIPYLEQVGEHIIQYELDSSILFILIAILSIILAIGMYKIYGNKDYVGFSAIRFLAIICIIASIVICHQFFDILAALTFPEKTIIEFISQYI